MKIWLAFCLALGSTVACLAQPQQGLVAWYPFNGNADDATCNGLNGTVFGATLTTDRFGNPDSAYAFDGASAYIQVADNDLLDTQAGESLTVCAWMRTADPNNWCVISKYNSYGYGGGWPSGFQIRADVDGVYFGGRDRTGYRSSGFAMNNVADLQWHLVVGMRSGSVWSIWVDGSPASSSDAGSTAAMDNVDAMIIGGCQDGGNPIHGYFSGQLDDIRIYNRALGAAEIQALYAEQPLPPPSLNLTILPAPADHVTLRWSASRTFGTYRVYGSSVENNDGDPNYGVDADWTLRALLPAPGAPGLMSYEDSAFGNYMNYVVEYDCIPRGRCCYGDSLNPSCLSPATEAECNALGGVWNVGQNCADNPCPMPLTHDDCANAVVVPSFPFTHSSDNTNATEDCDMLSGGQFAEVWYTFTTTSVCNLRISYCGTTPAFGNVYGVLDPGCPCTGSFVYMTSANLEECGDGNYTIHWDALPIGTYYWPLLTGELAEGPYTVTFASPARRCCYGVNCADISQAECTALGGVWTLGIDCTTPCPPPIYCAANGSSCNPESNDEFIGNVSLNTLDNASGSDIGSCYSDFTAISTTLNIGTDYVLTVTNSTTSWAADQCGAWVDWNNDFDFDEADETYLMAGSPGVGPYTITINPPIGSNGSHRMRVRICYNSSPLACGVQTYGEVEDYTIIVVNQ